MIRLVALLIGLALLGFIASQTDLAEVWRAALDLGAWGALAVCAVFLAGFVIDTASWQLMLPSVGLNARWLYRLWKIRTVGEALNLVIPAGSLGGEPAKAVLLKRSHAIGYREGAASLVIAKTVNLLALIVFAAVGFVLMLGDGRLTDAILLTAGVGLGALGLGVVGFYVVQRWRLASTLARRLSAWRLGARLAPFLTQIDEVDDRFQNFYAGQPGRFVGALALALVNWLVGMAELLVIMWLLDVPMTLAEACIVETAVQLVRAGAFVIPASLGATEVVMVLLYDLMTGRPALGLAVALIRRARELLWIAWGLWLGWRALPGRGSGPGAAPGAAKGSRP